MVYSFRETGFSAVDKSIKELADVTGTSVSSIVRFCKALGFKGYAEFKFHCQSGSLSPLSGQVEVTSNDSAGSIKEKVAHFATEAINNSIRYTDDAEIDRAIAVISADTD